MIGSDVYIGKDVVIDCPSSGVLKIGDRVILTQGIFISAASGVSIGNDSMVGEYSSIRDSNHGIELHSSMRGQALKLNDVKIGNDVWIGRGCAILAGVGIGDGAVCGANSVLTRDVDNLAIVAGNPAKILRYRE